MSCSRALSILAVVLAVALPAGAQEANSLIGGKNLDQWVRELRDRDQSVRENALRSVTLFGKFPQEHPDCLNAILSALQDSDTGVRANACIAIGLIGVDVRDNGNDKDKALVNQILAQLRLRLSDPQGIVRYQATAAFARLGSRYARQMIPQLAGTTIRDQSSWEIRKAAVTALGVAAYDPQNGPDPTALKALITTLVGTGTGTPGDYCALVRLEALNSLLLLMPVIKSGDIPNIQRAFEFAQKDPDRTISLWARYGLIQVNLVLIKDYEREIKLAKEQSRFNDVLRLEPQIKNLTGYNLGFAKQMAPYLNDKDLHVRCQACRAISLLGSGGKAQIPEIIKLMWDKQPTVADAAGAALFGMKEQLTDADLNSVAQLFSESEPFLRSRAAQMFATLGPQAKSQVPTLIAILKNPKEESDVLAHVILALGEIGEAAKPALPALTQLLKHPSETVRDAADEAIKLIERGKPMPDKK